MFGLSNVDRKKLLGEGASGKVFATFDGKYAYKEYRMDEISEDECFIPESLKEISIMKTLDDPYIQKAEEGIFDTGENGYFMRIYPFSLWELIQSMNINRELAKKILYQVL